MAKEVKINEVTKEVEVPIDLTEVEYNKLNERLALFNEGLDFKDKLTFEEFVSLVFRTNLLEEELEAKYSIGLEGSSEVFNEVIEQRIKTLKEPIVKTSDVKDFREYYINLLVNGILGYCYGMGLEDLDITLKEVYIEDIKANPSEVLEAITEAKEVLDVNTYDYEGVINILIDFEKYVSLI